MGSQEVCHSDFRIIAATNKDMAEAVKNGTIREDFFYRIHVFPINLPPLRDRKEDIPLLVDHFLDILSNGKEAGTIPGYIIDTLLNYDWPGNIRELQNVLQRYLTEGNLDVFVNHCVNKKSPALAVNCRREILHQDISYRKALDQFEKELILNALNKTRWNRCEVTRLLGIPRRTLYQKMKNWVSPKKCKYRIGSKNRSSRVLAGRFFPIRQVHSTLTLQK